MEGFYISSIEGENKSKTGRDSALAISITTINQFKESGAFFPCKGQQNAEALLKFSTLIRQKVFNNFLAQHNYVVVQDLEKNITDLYESAYSNISIVAAYRADISCDSGLTINIFCLVEYFHLFRNYGMNLQCELN